MGRRALRPVSKELDLSFHLLDNFSAFGHDGSLLSNDAPSQPEPAQSANVLETIVTSQILFGNEHPLELEIGSGKGLFMQTASEFAGNNFIGIEIARKYCRHAASRLAKRERRNARMIHGDAALIVRSFVPSDSLAAVHVYFPDPWWKKRHRKRRIMRPDVVQEIQRVLIPDGVLHFWTDVEEYYLTTLEMLQDFPILCGPDPVEERAAQHHLDYRTHFERRMRLHGESVYRSEYRKRIDDT